MPSQRIYVETTIPSAYYTNRTAPEMVERREITRRWWKEAVGNCELVASAVVLGELRDGTSEHVPFRLSLVRNLDLLDLTPAVYSTADVYMHRKLMPSNPPSDALHLALASHYNCDVLATWNYNHLANANKLEHIRMVNTGLGLPVPFIATPRQLLGGQDDRA
ncbi:type II toxin-antitoxin system VapC family toxin [Longimicrobium sp.]|uniref:type II toxin-antitoxin system VapC family toxin n=1 Tax=Longimicrobium sp. TaxID=2029185 RepID=UPI003B3B2968